MKKQLYQLLLGGCLLSLNAVAQAPFTTAAELDVNHFRARHMVHGDMWYNAALSAPACEYPKGSGRHASYAGSIWMSGIDGAGQLHTAAALYGKGNDYWPGPLDPSGALSYASSSEWARFWKVNRKDILDYLALSSPTLATIPPVVLEWPAKGNANARGASGMGLTVDRPMAPFVDADGDGLYDPLKGDYPDMKGDQMIWWVFSDNGPVHDMSKGRPFKVEYHAMAYAYNRGGVEADMLFYEYTMLNRSTEKYDQFRFGLFSDADLGCPFDDYIAFDRAHRMGIEYNAGAPDCPNGINSYGTKAPMTGLTFLEMPGDHYPDMVPAGSFNTTYSGSGRPPAIDTEFHHFLHARDIYGTPMPDTFMYELAPGKGECELKLPGGDRRYVITSNDYAFQPGTVAKIAMAFIATDTAGYACPVSSFKPITDLADSAWKIYHNPLPPLSMDEYTMKQQLLKIYPNPASGTLCVDLVNIAVGREYSLQVYDVTGRRLQLAFSRNANTLSADISSLTPGIYSLVYDDGTQRHAQTFVKR